ncbi:uncharacterized protein LOC144703461 [Wolffia australiana]
MEQKHIITAISAVGLGVGLGLGLASDKWTTSAHASLASGVTAERVEQELLRQVADMKDSSVTFDEFPYYLSDQTRTILTSAAYVHLKPGDLSKYTRNLSPASRAILLSGPTELFPQMLAKALAHFVEAKLLLLDVTDFSLKMQSKYGSNNQAPSGFKRSISETTLEKMSSLFGSFAILPQKEEPKGTLRRQSSGVDISKKGNEGPDAPKLRRNVSAVANFSSLASQTHTGSPVVPLKRCSSWCFDEKMFVQSLYKVLLSVAKVSPIILYVRNVEKVLSRSQRMYSLFQKMLHKLTGPVLVIGSRIYDYEPDEKEVEERFKILFPYNIAISPPEDHELMVSWNYKLEADMKLIKLQDNRNHILEVLAANDLECDDLGSICLADTMALGMYIEEAVMSAVSYHLMNNKVPEYRNGKLLISSKSLSHGLNVFQKGGTAETSKDPKKEDAKNPENKSKKDGQNPEKKEGGDPAAKPAEVAPDNEFEKRIRSEVIPASKIGVSFDDIGSMDEIKESLEELVMLPLRRPDLFKGGLLKPCRGILLFGPPGTGKTMLAKAIAKEAGASFINVSMSTITSKWFGEDEKNVRALFTLAAKVSPTIIFVDEVDSMLGQRSRVGEHEAVRKIKNEFMTHWDGLLTKPGERILVLAATNRPFDLDEAIIRRFERRIMVGLPAVESRESILRTLLAKEKVEEGLNYRELATMTEGYSGSDLKNLCATAAYRPVRELLQRERKKELEKKKKGESASAGEGSTEKGQEDKITLRPLNMEDMRQAKNQVAASFATEGAMMGELKQWNELYGEGGSRQKQQLSYFL